MLTFMQIMEKKGLVGHKRVGKAYAYFPRLKRDRTYQKLAGGFLDNVLAQGSSGISEVDFV